MEVVAQWLDDIEDMVFALPLASECLRARCLHVGFVSSLILAGLEGFRVLVEFAPVFALAAGASVGLWTISLVVTEIAERRYELARPGSAATP